MKIQNTTISTMEIHNITFRSASGEVNCMFGIFIMLGRECA